MFTAGIRRLKRPGTLRLSRGTDLFELVCDSPATKNSLSIPFNDAEKRGGVRGGGSSVTIHLVLGKTPFAFFSSD
jgi:hypothetical protein